MNDQLHRQLGERLEHPDTFAWLVDQLPAGETRACLRAWGRVHGVYPASLVRDTPLSQADQGEGEGHSHA